MIFAPLETVEFFNQRMIKVSYLRLTFLAIIFLFSQKDSYSQHFTPIANAQRYGIKFSHLPGEYDSSINLRITRPANIKLTFRNSDSTSIPIKGDTITIKIKTTASIYMTVNNTGQLIDSSYVGTYVIGKKSDLPIINLHLKRKYFDGDQGIINGYMDYSNHTRYGKVWSKFSIPTYLEYYEDKSFVFGETYRVKPFGGWTLGMREKSLRVYSEKTEGTSKIKISPFENKPYLSYKSIVLRTSGSDQGTTRLKDISICSLAKDLGLDYQDYRQAVLLINGEYWGIYDIREKINYEYLKYNHGASKDKTQTELLELDGMRNADYKQMTEYIGKDFKKEEAFDSINQKIDIENYIKYIILQIHIQNIDSRGNVRFWKSKSLDDRWRWIFYDSDLGCENSSINMNYLGKRLSPVQTDWYNPTWSTVILRNLVKNEEIKNYFINQYCLLLGTKLQTDTIKNRIEYFANNIRDEIPQHVNRRNRIYGETVEKWNKRISNFKKYFDLRNPTAYEHMKECFGLTQDAVSLTIKTNLPQVKSLNLYRSSYNFSYIKADFFPEIPITIKASNVDHLYYFSHWKQNSETNSITTVYPGKSTEIEAVYMHKPYSELHKKIVVAKLYFEQSKKDTLFTIGLMNVGNDSLEQIKINYSCNGYNDSYEFTINKIRVGEIIYFTNKTKKSSKLLSGSNYNQITLPEGFDYRGGKLVFSDINGAIIDTLFINVPDTAARYNHLIKATRNIQNGKWMFGNYEIKFVVPEKPVDYKLYVAIVLGAILILSIPFFFIRSRRRKQSRKNDAEL